VVNITTPDLDVLAQLMENKEARLLVHKEVVVV